MLDQVPPNRSQTLSEPHFLHRENETNKMPLSGLGGLDDNAHKLTFKPPTPQLTDLRILKVRRSEVQKEHGGPGAPTLHLSKGQGSKSSSEPADTSAPLCPLP